MNAQTRREMAEKCVREIAYSAMLFDMGHTARVNIVEHYLREWGLEMAKIAAETEIVLDNHPAWGFSVRCEKAARLITHANAE